MKTVCDGCAKLAAIPGDAHSACKAPSDPVLAMVAAIYGVGNVPKLNAHGVSNGWCMWPMNFDPIWIMECPLKVQAGQGVAA